MNEALKSLTVTGKERARRWRAAARAAAFRQRALDPQRH
jgi:hypothetical protein